MFVIFIDVNFLFFNVSQRNVAQTKWFAVGIFTQREMLHQHFDKVRPGMNFLNRFDKILFENTVLV